MNKRSVWLITICIVSNQLFGYTPATGPLQLGDTKNINPNGTLSIVRGIIMQDILTEPQFQREKDKLIEYLLSLNIIKNHDESSNIDDDAIPFYQDIMQQVINSKNTTISIKILEMFEKIIMYRYDYAAYLIGSSSEPGWQKTIWNGFKVRKSWIDITSYVKLQSWFGDNNLVLGQLIAELDNIANVTATHSQLVANRMRAIAHSYRNWRKYIATIFAAGAASLIGTQAIEAGKNLGNMGLEMFKNKISQSTAGKFAWYGLPYVAQYGFSYLKPLVW